MEDNVQKLNIQPKASVYDTFSNYSYKVWYSIAEFVDNSTSSFYKYERALKFYRQDQLRIDIEYDSVNHILRIIDNAYGMEIEDFKRAILLGSKPSDNTGRNEFGMGLKTAASWFGKWWSVTSTQLGSNNRYTAVVDIPKLYETDEIDIVTTKCPKEEHGTVIEIRNLTKKIEGGKTIGKIKEVLRSMYRRDLNSGKVKIFFKNEERGEYFMFLDRSFDGLRDRKTLDIFLTKEDYQKELAQKEQKDQERKAELQKRKAALIKKYGHTNGTLISEGKVRIGMTKEMCRESWGEPEDINKTTGSYGTHEQWVYGYGSYLYFENGKLTTIQN